MCASFWIMVARSRINHLEVSQTANDWNEWARTFQDVL